MEADRWFARMQAGDCSAAERAACKRWREADPEHQKAYLQAEAVYGRSVALRRDPEFLALGQSVRTRASRRRRLLRTWRWGGSLSAAAAVVLVAGLALRAWDPAQPEHQYATALGEQRTWTLEDGSRLLLDTDSAVRVRYSRKQRNVTLEKGQAQFAVARAPQRPFVVQAGAGEIRALGTRFQVRKRDARVQVTLLEGAVRVDAPGDARPYSTTLAPMEQLSFDGRALWDRNDADPEVADGWTRGELVLRQRSLSELVEEMNRYTSNKVRFADPKLRDLKISAVFSVHDQASLIQALELGWPVRAEVAAGGEVVLHYRD